MTMSNHNESIARFFMAGIVVLPLLSCEGPQDNKTTITTPPQDQPQLEAKDAARALFQPPVENPTFAQVIVTGSSPDHLQQFDTKIRAILGVTDDAGLAAKMIGCVDGCEKFGTASPPTRLVYVFPREYSDILAKFGNAWDQTQKAVLDKNFALRIDADIATPDCDTVNDPQPCQSYSFCPIDRCGRKMSTGIVNCSIC
jgi:hypothetical protein